VAISTGGIVEDWGGIARVEQEAIAHGVPGRVDRDHADLP
jgi:hypothetical protein